MNFARKQLEKYGWTDGKGLGKNENGISEALKPKLKRSVAGIGYDAAADFTEHWWSTLYDKAAKNVEVEEKNGKTKKMKRKDNNDFEITNSTWRLKHKPNNKNKEQYSDFFVKTVVLDVGGSKTTKVKDSDSDSDSESNKDATKMTDDELFSACEGRTAHKGARHGLRALGKLARIEQQEQILLQQAKYNNFLQKSKNTSDLQVVEDTSLNDEVVEKKKKRKKKKRCNSFENGLNTGNIEISEVNNIPREESKEILQNEEMNIQEHDGSIKNEVVQKEKRKNINSPLENNETSMVPEIRTENEFVKKKKKKKNK